MALDPAKLDAICAAADALGRRADAMEARRADAEPLASRWNRMSTEERQKASMAAGWTTNAGGPGPVAKRHAKTAWEDIPEGSRATLERFNK